MTRILQPTLWGFHEYVFWILILIAIILLVLSIRNRNWKMLTAFFSILLSAFAFLSFFGLDLKRDTQQTDVSIEQIDTIAKQIMQRLSEKSLKITLRTYHNSAIGKDQLIKTVREIAVVDPKNADPIERKRLKALIALHDNDFETAERILSDLVHDVVKSKDSSPQDMAEAYRQLGSVAFYNDSYRAISAYKKATINDQESFDGWNQLGRLYMQIGKPELAKLCFKEVLSLAQQQRDPYATVVAYDNLGNIAYFQGDLEEAEKLYLQALSWIEAYNDKKVIAFPCSNLGNIYADKGDLEKALKYYNMALEMIPDGEESELFGNLSMNIGSIAVQNNQVGKAEKMFIKANKIFTKIRYREGIAKLYANYGLLYARKGDFGAARAHFETSVDKFIELDNVEAAKKVQNMLNVINQ